MNTTMNNSLKAVACGFGALAITVAMSWSLVSSTSQVSSSVAANRAAPTAQVTQMAQLTIRPRHVWFGQAQPAALVD